MYVCMREVLERPISNSGRQQSTTDDDDPIFVKKVRYFNIFEY